MHQFFDIKNLTSQQQENLETAKVNYEKISNINVEREFAALSDKEKLKLQAIYKAKNDIELKEKRYEFSNAMHNNANEKSALFARLLEGKKPLVFRPPTSFSSPWYSVIEENETIELTMFEDTLKVKDFIKKGEINIHQNLWKVLSITSDQEALVTIGDWEELGFVWKFYLDKIRCTDTKGFICAHHDHTISRVSTLDQLTKEQLFQVKLRFDNINLVLDAQYAQKQEKKSIEKYGQGFGKATFSSRLSAGQQLLQERKSHGLTDYPTQEEIQLEVDAQVKRYFDRDITVDDSGNLYSFTWVLQRISPVEVGPEIYMEI